MDAPLIYAIVVGGIFVLLFMIKTAVYLANRPYLFTVPLLRHVALPVFIPRVGPFGPWTRATTVLYLLYITTNIFLVLLKTGGTAGVSRRAGTLALINLILPLSTIHLSTLADFFGIYLRTSQRVHRVTGWMGVILLCTHVITAWVEKPDFPISESQNLYTLVGAGALGALAILSLPLFRHWSYEVFLRTHHILSGVFVYGTWRHLPNRTSGPGIYLTVALGLFSFSIVIPLIMFLHANGLFAGRGTPRAVISFKYYRGKDDNGNSMMVLSGIVVHLVLPRPLKIDPGQYINIWIPGVGLRAWMQTHPFMVTSWSGKKQDTLSLLIQPQKGLSKDYFGHATGALDSSISFLALFTGPHGISEDIGNCETALIVASDSGVAAAIPYIQKMIYGYNTSTSRLRRVHLVWQARSKGELNSFSAPLAATDKAANAVLAQDELNQLLEDDTILNEPVKDRSTTKKGYIFHLSVYLESGLEGGKLPFGGHQRAFVDQGEPDYRSLVSQEASGELIEKTPNIPYEQGQLLLMISAADPIRYELREIMRGYISERIKLLEVEYQPYNTTSRWH
ncbi:ferric reductase family protein [Aspergillus undulatus]|uniref:ferric reductase family protein n=1 Tax=Aspergillus undulatus TaxID=1810928 RepID=UPI003CCD1708